MCMRRGVGGWVKAGPGNTIRGTPEKQRLSVNPCGRAAVVIAHLVFLDNFGHEPHLYLSAHHHLTRLPLESKPKHNKVLSAPLPPYPLPSRLTQRLDWRLLRFLLLFLVPPFLHLLLWHWPSCSSPRPLLVRELSRHNTTSRRNALPHERPKPCYRHSEGTS